MWGCDPVLFGSVQNVDILARDPKTSMEIIIKAMDILKKMHVDTYPLDNVDQTRCENNEDGERDRNQGDRNTNNINIVAEEP